MIFQGMARPGQAWHGGRGQVRLGGVRLGKAGPGEDRQGSFKRDRETAVRFRGARSSGRGWARLGGAGWGPARHDKARIGRAFMTAVELVGWGAVATLGGGAGAVAWALRPRRLAAETLRWVSYPCTRGLHKNCGAPYSCHCSCHKSVRTAASSAPATGSVPPGLPAEAPELAAVRTDSETREGPGSDRALR